ncbi:DUF1802 family protein [Leptolyngbya sp. NK1-12]|uniref:DUF1802 family protein n=1 Tax=Leptolyngbya sp. NK1-12 TaxID=2547451 RepID=A0AA96WK09_9CYAN|nr:DUF1802 family protein [Leptolyngbya sp. NK1-12]
MLDSVLLDRVLCLPAIDIAVLLQGRLIAVIPKISVQKEWVFALYPCTRINDGASVYQQYRQHVFPLIDAVSQQQSQPVKIEAWAKCESCKLLYDVEQVDALSSLTIWAKEPLREAFKQRQNLFLAFLRVYRMPEPIEVSQECISPEKLGKFVGLPALGQEFCKPLRVTQFLPVLDEAAFLQRKQHLEELKPPPYLELEELHSAVAQLAKVKPEAKVLAEDISTFLGWSNIPETIIDPIDPDLHWIKTIAEVGNSSDGHQFEKLVRKSLIKLGFSNSRDNMKASLDPEATGGAGGIDFYCDAPFPVVGECKATKSEKIPSKTPGQLLQLGKNHLQEDYDPCIKMIVAAGELTQDAELTAVTHQMNIIRPETLQRLVEFKVKYPGAVDLLELKPILEKSPFGEEADTKLNQYVDNLEKNLRIRSHVVKALKRLAVVEPDRKQFEVTEIRVQYNASFAQNDGVVLDNQAVYEYLIELSSPLAGYLGRVKVSGISSDRFYFLRELNPLVE